MSIKPIAVSLLVLALAACGGSDAPKTNLLRQQLLKTLAAQRLLKRQSLKRQALVVD